MMIKGYGSRRPKHIPYGSVSGFGYGSATLVKSGLETTGSPKVFYVGWAPSKSPGGELVLMSSRKGARRSYQMAT
jgi:hypothetical protein